MKKRCTAGSLRLKHRIPEGYHKSTPPLNRAQAVKSLLAPLKFSTPLCKVRYQKMAAFAERCCFFCRKAASFNTRKANSKNSSVFVQKTSAFLEKIRGPPSEIWFSSIKFQSKEVCTMADTVISHPRWMRSLFSRRLWLQSIQLWIPRRK